ncbi:MAG: hypothetical protein KBH29_08730 [Lutibacter sp.]|nr:hypothetical protein [Lutibacter sp.]
MMNKPIINFALKLIIATGILFSIHAFVLYFLNTPIFTNRIELSYIINYMLAVSIYAFLYKLRIKYLDILGFIYMAGSFVKFGFFFLFFYPVYHKNGKIDIFEATTFMTPYILCLFFETFYLIKLLNNKV